MQTKSVLFDFVGFFSVFFFFAQIDFEQNLEKRTQCDKGEEVSKKQPKKEERNGCNRLLKNYIRFSIDKEYFSDKKSEMYDVFCQSKIRNLIT